MSAIMSAGVAMAAVAALFALFGALRVADRKSCGGGCAGCETGCDLETEGRHR